MDNMYPQRRDGSRKPLQSIASGNRQMDSNNMLLKVTATHSNSSTSSCTFDVRLYMSEA